jgi:hypothetical protein
MMMMIIRIRRTGKNAGKVRKLEQHQICVYQTKRNEQQPKSAESKKSLKRTKERCLRHSFETLSFI